MTSEGVSEEERIAAWRAERTRIAEADRAVRLATQKAAQSKDAEEVAEKRQSSALTFLRAVEPTDVFETTEPSTLPSSDSHASQTRGLVGILRQWPPFLVMVLGPVAVAALYLFAFATPLYEAQSVIAITRSSEAGSGGSSGILGNMGSSSNLSEVFRADEYIRSQALMDSLEAELGLVTEFSGNSIDPVRRLRTIPVLSLSKHMQFDRFVESSIDVQSGLLKLYVRAPEREQAISISQAVLRNAEIQVSQLGEQLFDNRQSFAAEMREAAESQVSEAQSALIALQLKYQEVDPKLRIESIYSRIKELEDQAQSIRDNLQVAAISGVRNKTRTDYLVELESSIREQITQERSKLVTANGSVDTPLNNLLIEYELAGLNVELARQAVRTAIEAQAESRSGSYTE